MNAYIPTLEIQSVYIYDYFVEIICSITGKYD